MPLEIHYSTVKLLKLFRRPLCHLHRYTSSLAPSTYMLHVLQWISICRYSSVWGILYACVFDPSVMLRKVTKVHVYAQCFSLSDRTY